MRLRDHVLALALGLVTSLLLLAWAMPAPRSADLARPPYWFKDYAASPEVERRFEQALDQRAFVLLGTCDLNVHEETPDLPSLYFPERLGLPTFAIGRGGMQSLAMLTQLAAFYDHLRDRKLVIMVAPEWFSDAHGRTGLADFLEYAPTPVLARAIFASAVPERYLDRIADYVAAHSAEIGDPSLALRYLGARGRGDLVRAKVYRAASRAQDFWLGEKVVPRLETLADRLGHGHEAGGGSVTAPYRKTAGAVEVPLPIKEDRPQLDSPELTDFRLLAGLLRDSGARPLVVIQGLNPQAFAHWRDFGAVTSALAQILREHGLSFVDLTREQYPAGYFQGLRIGDAQWVEIDRMIRGFLLEGRA